MNHKPLCASASSANPRSPVPVTAGSFQIVAGRCNLAPGARQPSQIDQTCGPRTGSGQRPLLLTPSHTDSRTHTPKPPPPGPLLQQHNAREVRNPHVPTSTQRSRPRLRLAIHPKTTQSKVEGRELLLVILGVVWLVLLPAGVLSCAWAGDLRRRGRVLPAADTVPVILLGVEVRTAAPACRRRIAAGLVARRARCPAPAAPIGAR